MERRRELRARTLKSARILLNHHQSVIDCVVRNLSPTGACLKVETTLGIPDRFIEHGSREGCLRAAGLDAAGLGASIERWWALQAPERLRSAGGA